MALAQQPDAPRRELDLELDRFEAKISELKVQYEQYFLDIVALPPLELEREVKRMIRELRTAPFKKATTKFRLNTLVQRYQTFNNYWERVKKEREAGTYKRDVFKAKVRAKQSAPVKRDKREKRDPGMDKMFDAYKSALKKTGGSSQNVDYAGFKKSLMKQAKTMKEKHGVSNPHFKIKVKDGKVVIKASKKK